MPRPAFPRSFGELDGRQEREMLPHGRASRLNWGFIAPKFSSSFRSEPAAKSRTKVPSSSTPDPLGRTRAAYRPSGEISVTTPSATRVSSPPRVGTQYDVNPFSDWRLKYRRRPSALKQAGHSLAG